MWFRDDLRIAHNEALAAAATHGPVTAVYIAEDPTVTGVRPLGGAAKWWLHHSLSTLIERLAEHDIPLVIRSGDPRMLLPGIVAEVGAEYVSWSRRYLQPQRELDEAVKEALRAKGTQAHSFPGYLLAEPWTISTGQGGPYKVFTPFSKKLQRVVQDSLDVDPTYPNEVPESLRGPGSDLDSSRADLAALALLPAHPARSEPDWTGGLAEHWTPGEPGAWERLRAFRDSLAEGAPGYAEGRDIPGISATSRLSPHLRFGEISPRAVWQEVVSASVENRDLIAFHSELMWRDFAWHRLYHRPDLATVNVRREFDGFDWSWDPEEFTTTTAGGRDGRRSVNWRGPAKSRIDPTGSQDFRSDLSDWRSGTTGIPLVDAGMRELWRTGHMHNRVRMIVASFLTKNLGIHWRHGEEWFWDTLVDADPASNAFNWQWSAGCGDDASPYFRIFNPETQAKRFDPDGVYLAEWVPELGAAEYPAPIVDLAESRAIALAAYQDIKR